MELPRFQVVIMSHLLILGATCLSAAQISISKSTVVNLGIDGFTTTETRDKQHKPETEPLIDLFSAGIRPRFPNEPFYIPDLSNITSKIGRHDFFDEMNGDHMQATQDLAELLRGFHRRSYFANVALQLREHQYLNPTVWIRAVLGTIMHRRDRDRFRIPPLIEVEPDLVLPTEVVRELQNTRDEYGTPSCVVVDERHGADNGPENALWYFREDPMVNSHHWFYHLSNPWHTPKLGHRHGELFYSMHHSMVARYQTERLCNDLPLATAFAFDRTPFIPDGYNPHLTDLNSKQAWVPRPARLPPPPWIVMKSENVSMEEARRWHNKLVQAIDDEYLILPNGANLSLANRQGIEHFSLTLESSSKSVNTAMYGKLGYHNSGHSFIGNAVRRGEPTPTSPRGVMSGTVAAMRDPIFYRWHQHINEIYERHKYKLKPYKVAYAVGRGEEDEDLALGWPGVHLESVEVYTVAAVSPPASESTYQPPVTPNLLRTFWTYTRYDLTNGLDFKKNSSLGDRKVEVCVKHLDHEEFVYKIKVLNSNGPHTAAVRIFLAPRYGPNGSRFPISEQHKLFFPLDTFTVDLSEGVNEIRRSSTDSTTTISFHQGLTELNDDQGRARVFCGCGWPNYMLIPKGKPGPGMVFDLFVMVTPEEKMTRIPKHIHGPLGQRDGAPGPRSQCQEAYIMCGRPNRAKFPDEKPMLYPFDRRPWVVGDGRRDPAYLDDFMRGLTNMASVQLIIKHEDSDGGVKKL